MVAPPFDLGTFGACSGVTPPTVSVSDVTVAEDAGVASVTVTLSAATTSEVTVEVSTVDGTAVAPGDYTAVTAVPVTIPAGGTGQTVDITIVDDSVAGEGNETFTVSLANPVGAALGTALATVTIVDDEFSACGAPTYDIGTEQATFLWRDCTTGTWSARMTAGGSFVAFEGDLVGDQAFTSLTAVSIESSDVLDNTTDPAVIDYTLFIAGSNLDGFDFTYPVGGNVCFAPTDGLPVYVGASRTPVTPPFDLGTLGACGP